MEVERLTVTYTIDSLQLCSMLLQRFHIWNRGCLTASWSYIHTINVWLCQVKSDSNLLIPEFETSLAFMDHLGLIPENISRYFTSGTTFKVKKGRQNPLYFAFSTRLLRDHRAQLPSRWSVKITTFYLTALAADAPSSEGLEAGSPSVSTFSSLPFRAGSWFQTPHSFLSQQRAEKPPASPYTHSQMSSGKNITSRENLHTFSLVVNSFSP